MSSNVPRTFPFDEFYEMLKEYVSDPKAREALALYDAEYAAGRGGVYDTGSEVATDANSDFIAVGWSILSKHGWPTYWEALAMQRTSGNQDVIYKGNTFPQIARELIRTGPESKFPDKKFSIDDEASVEELLRLRMQNSSKYEIYTLPRKS